ncbi:hypothetical protein [Hymenobacter fodinae]|uniref:Uncharacterized protein n=1 Tax=Hymenobacter fodinae TaxID=2510796 RepID=A0A4Z0P8L8_9BACT|nr:hypothetical protein [Hymenobacter fodinae]TGE07726.1 hypothetical protein EU556_08205 [Hymenobacter fodinae]
MSTTQYTEASVEEALLILDNALTLPASRYDELPQMIDWAVQKLRPVKAPQQDEAALAELAKKYPIELPWMQQAAPMVVIAEDTPAPKCSPLSCDGCPTCEVTEVNIVLSKRALKSLSFQQKVELCDAVGVHFALLDAVLLQPGAQQSSFTAAQFSQLVSIAIQRHKVVADILKGGEGA